MTVPIPRDEAARIASLIGCSVLDSAPERQFDDIVAIASQVCDAPMALVTLVDAERQWFKARIGLSLSETPRDVSFCAHAILGRVPLVIEDATKDERFAKNPLVVGEPRIRFYAGVPLRIGDDAMPVGSLCVLDRVPRKLRPGQLEALAALARRAEVELVARRERLLAHQSALPAKGSVVAGRYVIGEPLGSGGMGAVLAAIDQQTRANVAIKFVTVSASRHARLAERFVREARALLSIRNEHVARILDAGNTDEGAPFIVMERLAGEDLSFVVQRGPLPVAQAVDLVREACEGLAAVHAQGVVHRDVKPANLFLAQSSPRAQVLKLLDFGVAVSVEEQASDARLTDDTAVIGSLHYMAPEQMLGERTIDARADVWSLGVVLYELLAGRVPFDGNSVSEVCARVFTAVPAPLDSLRADVPPLLSAAVDACLRRAPAERCPDVTQLSSAIAPFGSRRAT